MGAPSIYVYDCSNAGIIVNSFNTFAEQHERELEQMQGNVTGSQSQLHKTSTTTPPQPPPPPPSSSSQSGVGISVSAAVAAAAATTGGAGGGSGDDISGGGQGVISSLISGSGGGTTTFKNCIQLAACSGNQILPMNPHLPADLFTACLTTPIKIALKWYTLQKSAELVPHVTYELIEK